MSGATTHAPAVAPQASPAMSFGPALRLQRKCSCGGAKCDACSKKKKGLQAKLEVGASDDHFEREADRAAEQVMNGAHAPGTTAAPMQLQRVSGGASGLGEAPAEVQQVLGSPGSALDAGARSFFESRFGHDFSRVRVHHDAQADASARAVGAKAYTVGSNVVFASGQYAPHSTSGRHLMAHELAHVVQQGQGGARLQREPDKVPPTTKFSPKKDSRWRVLSEQEIQADPRRKAAMKTVDEAQARAFPSSMKGGKPKGARVLDAGTEVAIDMVDVPETDYAADGAVFPTGSGIYKVTWGTGNTGFVYSPALAPVAKAKEEKPASKPPEAPKVTYTIVEGPLAKQEPPDVKRILDDAIRNRTPMTPEELTKLLKSRQRVQAGRAEMLIQKFAAQSSVPFPTQQNFLQFMIGDLRLDTQPDYQLKFAPMEALNGNFTLGLGTLFPKAQARETAEYRAPFLKEEFIKLYIDPSIDAIGLATEDEATNALLMRIDNQRRQLEPKWREQLDKENHQSLSSWEELAYKVERKLEAQTEANELAAAAPKAKKLTGAKLDKVVGKHQGTSSDAASSDLKTLRDEKERREGKVASRKQEADTEANRLRGKDLQSRLAAMSLDQQLQTMGKVFGFGFIAGLEYELPEGSMANIASSLTPEELPKFQFGVHKGLLPGAGAGILEALAGLLELAGMVGAFGIDVATDLAKDLYEPVLDGEAYLDRKRKQTEKQKKYIDAFLSGAKKFVKNFQDDPAFLADAAFPIGEHAGRSVATTLDEQLTGEGLSSEDRGYFVGKVTGRIAIEILMAVVAPEELALQAAARAGVLRGAKVFKAVEEVATKVDDLVPLIDARKALDKAEDLGKLAKEGKLLDEGVDGARKLDNAVPDVPGSGRADDVPKPKGDKAPEVPRSEKPATDGSAPGKTDDAPKPKSEEAPKPKADADPAPKPKQVREGFLKQAGHDEFGHAHAVNVTPDRSVCLCSPAPCPRMAKLYAQELRQDGKLAGRLAKAEKMSDAEQAADEGIEVFRAIVKKRKKKMQGRKPKAAATKFDPPETKRGFDDLDEHGPGKEPSLLSEEDDLPELNVLENERGAGGVDPDAKDSRKALRDELGPPPSPEQRAWEAHHIVPYELRNHPSVYEYERLVKKIDNPKAAVEGRALNSKESGIHLPSSDKVPAGEGMSIHRGSHPHYTAWIESRLDQLWYEYSYNNLKLDDFAKRYEDLVGEFENKLRTGALGKPTKGGRRVVR